MGNKNSYSLDSIVGLSIIIIPILFCPLVLCTAIDEDPSNLQIAGTFVILLITFSMIFNLCNAFIFNKELKKIIYKRYRASIEEKMMTMQISKSFTMCSFLIGIASIILTHYFDQYERLLVGVFLLSIFTCSVSIFQFIKAKKEIKELNNEFIIGNESLSDIEISIPKS